LRAGGSVFQEGIFSSVVDHHVVNAEVGVDNVLDRSNRKDVLQGGFDLGLEGRVGNFEGRISLVIEGSWHSTGQ